MFRGYLCKVFLPTKILKKNNLLFILCCTKLCWISSKEYTNYRWSQGIHDTCSNQGCVTPFDFVSVVFKIAQGSNTSFVWKQYRLSIGAKKPLTTKGSLIITIEKWLPPKRNNRAERSLLIASHYVSTSFYEFSDPKFYLITILKYRYRLKHTSHFKPPGTLERLHIYINPKGPRKLNCASYITKYYYTLLIISFQIKSYICVRWLT